MVKVQGSCGVCGYPLVASAPGEQVTCPMCNSVNEAISQGVVVPTTLFWSVLSFGLGVILGPAIITSTTSGQKWLKEKARF